MIGVMDRQADQTPWQRLGNKFTLGLRTRAEADWLPYGDAFGDSGRRADQLAEKAFLFETRRDEVFATLDGSADGCADRFFDAVRVAGRTPEPESTWNPSSSCSGRRLAVATTLRGCRGSAAERSRRRRGAIAPTPRGERRDERHA